MVIDIHEYRTVHSGQQSFEVAYTGFRHSMNWQDIDFIRFLNASALVMVQQSIEIFRLPY